MPITEVETERDKVNQNCGKNWKELSLAVGVTSVFFLIFLAVSWIFVSKRAETWGRYVRHYDSLESNQELSLAEHNEINPVIHEYLKSFGGENKALKQRIVKQLTDVKNRARTHLRVARDLTIWSAITLSNATVFSVIAGLCLLHIARRGLDTCNSYITGIFIFSVGISTVSGTFTVVYQYEDNIQANSNLYITYINLEDKILSELSTQKFVYVNNKPEDTPPAELEQVTLEKLIMYTHYSLEKLHSISYEMDLTAIPSPDDIARKLNQSTAFQPQ